MYEQNAGHVYRLCFLYLKNAADAEDAVQNVFLKYWNCRRTFKDEEHKKAWLLLTAKNHCKDVLRGWWRSRRSDPEEIPEPAAPQGESRELWGLLTALPDPYKVVLYLYYYMGYPAKEIARMLRRNESTVRTQLAKGRERLKLNLGGDQDGNEFKGVV